MKVGKNRHINAKKSNRYIFSVDQKRLTDGSPEDLGHLYVNSIETCKFNYGTIVDFKWTKRITNYFGFTVTFLKTQRKNRTCND